MKSKTKITIEAWRRTTIRLHDIKVARCARCAAKTLMLSPGEFARLSGTPPRVVYRQIECGKLHFIETEGGELLVCCNSLKNQIEGENL